MIDWQRDGPDRLWSMWTSCGLGYRANIILRVGASVPVHHHDFDHMASIRAGVFLCKVEPPDAPAYERILAAQDMPRVYGADGDSIEIPRFHRHLFTLLASGVNGPGQFVCIFPEGKGIG